MKPIKVQVKNIGANKLPEYATDLAAGLDIRANLSGSSANLKKGHSMGIPTGLTVAIPEGFELQVRPRSGLAANHGISVLNSPATIDADYRGEIFVILVNHSSTPFRLHHGTRIGQLVLKRVERLEWEEVDKLPETARGEGGLGSTGND